MRDLRLYRKNSAQRLTRQLATAIVAAAALLQMLAQAQTTEDPAGLSDAVVAPDPVGESAPASASDAAGGSNTDGERHDRLLDDLKDFAAMPLHWRGREWLRFGGLVAAVGVAYRYDDRTRAHFANDGEANYHEVQDAMPAAVVFGGTWLTGKLSNNAEARWEAGAMRRAVVLSAITVEVVKVATFRKRPGPGVTRDSWWDRGLSFPSGHTAAAFAIGTVLAESGDDRHRALRRALGYGLGVGTAYERLNHDAHWLSDTVAGAAFGIAAARFVMKRRDRPEPRGTVGIVPLDGGAMLTYTVPIR